MFATLLPSKGSTSGVAVVVGRVAVERVMTGDDVDVDPNDSSHAGSDDSVSAPTPAGSNRYSHKTWHACPSNICLPHLA